MDDVEQSGAETPVALTPHRYPAWIWLIGLGIVVMLAVALNKLPPYYRAATLVQSAETLAEDGHDNSAVEFYMKALEITPSSKRVRLGLAISYFRSPDEEDHKKGLGVLQGLTLDKDEWQKLTAVMPAAYQRLFTDVKQ
jgi:hypothetical protein